MMQELSLEAYICAIKDLGLKQKKVYETIQRLQPCSNNDISTYLNWSINRVTPRVLELRKKELIEKKGVKLNKWGRKENVWGCS